jgi:phage terminase small subunit
VNTKQTVFVEEYLKCWNSSEAARRAGYNGRSNQIGSRLLTNVDIKAEIDARIAELKMSTDEVLVRLADQARGSHADFTEVNLREDLKDHPKAHLVKTVISDVYEDSKGKIHHKLRFELYDAQAALVHIGKAHGLFADRVEHSGPGGGPIPFTEIIVELPDDTMEN